MRPARGTGEKLLFIFEGRNSHEKLTEIRGETFSQALGELL